LKSTFFVEVEINFNQSLAIFLFLYCKNISLRPAAFYPLENLVSYHQPHTKYISERITNSLRGEKKAAE
jgi:hypothetical protein